MTNEQYNEARNVEYDDIMSGAYADSRDSRIESIANSSEAIPTSRKSTSEMCRREKVGLGVMIGAYVLGLAALATGAVAVHKLNQNKVSLDGGMGEVLRSTYEKVEEK